jgi:hypothetical protein
MRRKIMINKTVSAVVVAGFVALSGSAVRAEPIMQPWCSTFRGYSSGGPECMYKTYQQCRASGAACVANPAMDPLPQAPPDADSPRQASQPPASRAAAARPGTVYLLENRKGVFGSSPRSRTFDNGRYHKPSGQLR